MSVAAAAAAHSDGYDPALLARLHKSVKFSVPFTRGVSPFVGVTHNPISPLPWRLRMIPLGIDPERGYATRDAAEQALASELAAWGFAPSALWRRGYAPGAVGAAAAAAPSPPGDGAEALSTSNDESSVRGGGEAMLLRRCALSVSRSTPWTPGASRFCGIVQCGGSRWYLNLCALGIPSASFATQAEAEATVEAALAAHGLPPEALFRDGWSGRGYCQI